MKLINEMQESKLISYLKDFLDKPIISNENNSDNYKDFDKKRLNAIPEIKGLLDKYLSDKISLEEFKETSETYSRRYPYWGFKNFSGQMQLNQYTNNIQDSQRDKVLRNCLLVPKDKDDAKRSINEMAMFLQALKEKADNRKSIPRVSQFYMLSYFWEMQANQTWPIYYGSLKKMLIGLNFDLESESPGDEYLKFMTITDEIKTLYKNKHGVDDKNIYWFVEHVLWAQFMKDASVVGPETKKIAPKGKVEAGEVQQTTGDWLPPIVSDVLELSYNKETPWSIARKTAPEKAFETKLKYCFTLLGFDTKELGQGTGRQPDGIALSMNVTDGDYALIYDAKSREKKYSVGTDDRKILEYINQKIDELKRSRIKKMYFILISSEFDESSTSIAAIKDVFKKTRVPVTFLKASDLLLIIEAKLENVDIDHGRLENLFLDTGMITRDKIISELGI